MPETTFRIELARADTEDRASFSVQGSDEWIKKTLPFVSLIIGGLVKSYGFDRANVDRVRQELNIAIASVAESQDYAGEFVTVAVHP